MLWYDDLVFPYTIPSKGPVEDLSLIDIQLSSLRWIGFSADVWDRGRWHTGRTESGHILSPIATKVTAPSFALQYHQVDPGTLSGVHISNHHRRQWFKISRFPRLSHRI